MFEEIKDSELERRSMRKVSTTPTKPTPFGESGLSADELKGRFDLLALYIAGRLNEIFRGLPNGDLASAMKIDGITLAGIIREFKTGEMAKKILVKTPTQDITLSDIAEKVVKLLDELGNGEFLKSCYLEDGRDVGRAVEETEALAKAAVPNMSVMDEEMFEKFGRGEKDYFFSQANWEDLQRYNRVYVQAYDDENDLRLGEDGKGLYALRAICRYGAGTVPRYPWLKKSDWVTRWREENPGTEISDEEIITSYPPSDEDFGDMATLIERQPNGFIKVPTGFPTDKTVEQMEGYTVPKKYADGIKEIALGAVQKVECPDKNRYVYTTYQNSKGESLIGLIKAGANPTPDVNQPFVRRRVNGAVGTLKIPEADDDAASKYYVNREVASIVGSAPETLNALNELAAALGNDPNFATTVANQIGSKAGKSELQETESAILEGLSAILASQEEILGGSV